MGGPSLIRDPFEVAKRRIDLAEKITGEQLARAKELHRIHFDGDNSRPEFIAAIVQALATNYLATVEAANQS
jgi:hypothetical protein